MLTKLQSQILIKIPILTRKAELQLLLGQLVKTNIYIQPHKFIVLDQQKIEKYEPVRQLTEETKKITEIRT